MRERRVSRRRAIGSTIGLLALAAACGGSPYSEFGDGVRAPEREGGVGAALPSDACTPACAAGQKCSVTRTCIAEGACAADGDCAAGMVCDAKTTTCIPGGTCGAEEATGTATPPNLLIVLDRSCSMKHLVGGTAKWAIAVDALTTLVKANAGKIRFGLLLFPDRLGTECAQATPTVPVGPNTDAQILSILEKAAKEGDTNYPDGPCVTNIDAAMERAAKEPAFADKSRGNFAVLLTDGKQSACDLVGGDTGTTQILGSMLQKSQVPTFVIGFGDEIDPAQMNVFAQAGGTARPNAEKYYRAEDKTSLSAALVAIANKSLSCTFALSKTPPDPSKMYAFFDNSTQVPRDATNGWEYDVGSNSVTFFGKACDDLRLAKVTDVDIVFGCPEATPR